MQTNRTKEKLARGELVIGTFLYIPSPRLAELFGLFGYDFVVIDQEHGPIGIESAEEMVRACEIGSATPFVRVASLQSHLILQALDIGGMGVHIPSVNTVEQARHSVGLCKYSPLGHRGLAGVRAARYGMREPLSEYCRTANEQCMVIIHIEETEAIRNLEAMLEVDGIDVYYLGPTDLSNSMGRPGIQDREVTATVDEALRRIIRAGKTAGMITNDINAAKRYLDMGVRYLATHALGHAATASAKFLKDLKG